MSSSTTSGSCLCGAVRFRVRLPSLFCAHCHCSMCRRNHGAGFVTWFVVPRAQLEIHEGEEDLRRYSSSSHGTRRFCARCGSSLFCESEHHPDRVDIPLANVDGPIDRAPQVHVYFDSRADWVEVSDALPRLGGPSGLEPLEALEPLEPDRTGGGAAQGTEIEMTEEAVSDLLRLFDDASIEAWIDGGWGVDALLEEQTRIHRDLDVILSGVDAPRLCRCLASRGFSVRPGGRPSNFVLEAPSGLEVDVHTVVFDRDGNGVFELEDGGSWPLPAAAFRGRGVIGGRSVRCLSADAQVRCHAQGYDPTAKDIGDMERLRARFGVALPPELCRRKPTHPG